MGSDKVERAEDLQLTGEEADRVKGGVLPIDGGGGAVSSSRTVQTKKTKRRHRKLGVHKDKH